MASLQEQQMVRSILRGIEAPVIVELGAHCGEDETWIRACCTSPVSRYVMVEPDGRNVQHILDKPGDAARRVILGAVSDQIGTAQFHFSWNEREQNRGSGSLLNPTGHLKYFPWVTFSEVGTVLTYTLDAIFDREALTRIDLLWVDIQGAERKMIRGGMVALQATRYLFIEAEDQELYEGEALKPELRAMLEGLGWRLIGDFAFNLLFENCGFQERML